MPRKACLHSIPLRSFLIFIASFSLVSLYFTYQVSLSNVDKLSYYKQHHKRYDYSETLKYTSELLERLKQWEKSYLTKRSHKSALIRGHPALLEKEAQTYSELLQKFGFSIHFSQKEMQKLVNVSTQNPGEKEWDLLFCLTFSDGEMDCLPRRNYPSLKHTKRINRIPGIRAVLWRRPSLCHTINKIMTLPSVSGYQFTAACYVLPEQYEEFLNFADGPGFNNSWMLKSAVAGSKIEHVSSMEFFGLVRTKRYSTTKESIIQQYIPNVMRINDMPISVQLFLLITSVAPMRFYIYKEGIAYFRYGEEKGFRKVGRYEIDN